MNVQLLNQSESEINLLPSAEIKYYLHLTFLLVKERYHELSDDFINDFANFISQLNKFYSTEENTDPTTFDDVVKSYKAMLASSQINTNSYLIQIHLIQIGSAFTAILFGMLGSLIGGICGLARGLWQLKPISGTLLGLMTGFYIGSALGFRAPKRLLKDPLLRQIKYALDGIEQGVKDLQEAKTINDYINEQKTFLIKNYFQNDYQQYEKFLKDDITFEIKTYKASFIQEAALYGYIGQHIYIKINIGQNERLIEFSPEPTDTSDPTDQCEVRTVKGSTIVQMLALHEKLIKTHDGGDLSFILKKMKPGEVDCFSYINKILLGTNQKTTQNSRHYGMNAIGRAIGFFSEYFSPFNEEYLRKAHKDDNSHPIKCNC